MRSPLAKELADLSFEGTPINGELIKQLASGAFLDDKRNIVLVGGTGTGKSHIAIGIARAVSIDGAEADRQHELVRGEANLDGPQVLIAKLALFADIHFGYEELHVLPNVGTKYRCGTTWDLVVAIVEPLSEAIALRRGDDRNFVLADRSIVLQRLTAKAAGFFLSLRPAGNSCPPATTHGSDFVSCDFW